MKKLFLWLTFAALFTNLHAQLEEQGEYTGFLEQALEAIDNEDEPNYTMNMKYFSTAIEQENITPEILTPKNFELYSECLLRAMDAGYFSLENFNPDNIAFLEYDIDNHPGNMILLGFIYSLGQYGFSKDMGKALYWYGKALGKGEERALYGLNVICMPNSFVTSEYCEEVMSVLKKGAENGLPGAIKVLGDYYLNKYQEYDKAIHWYQKAFDAGDVYQKAEAAKSMSIAYTIYSPVRSNKKSKQWKKESVALYEKFVEDFEKSNTIGKKNPDYGKFTVSLIYLASDYQYTLGIKDKKKAKFYKEKACENGLDTFCEGSSSEDRLNDTLNYFQKIANP